MRICSAVALSLLTAGCSDSPSPKQAEIFDLRTKCSKLAADLWSDQEGAVTQQSNYDAASNRCYALITVTSPGYTEKKGALKAYVVEVQSNRIIAEWQNVDGKASGIVDDWLDQQQISNPKPEQVAEFMDKVMRKGT